MNYVPQWERLSDAVERVAATVRMSKTEAQTAIARAIADGVIDLRAKLGRHTKSGMTYLKRVVERKDFRISTEINPEDIDWENSRPTNPWYVERGNADVPHGDWTLEWIELSRSDVTTVLCPAPNTGPPPPTSGKKVAKSKGSRALESARRAIEALYPKGVPDQVVLPNKALCKLVHDKLTHRVSDDTILRAAGRRK